MTAVRFEYPAGTSVAGRERGWPDRLARWSFGTVTDPAGCHRHDCPGCTEVQWRTGPRHSAGRPDWLSRLYVRAESLLPLDPIVAGLTRLLA
jgi:hypothetical protein